MESFNIIADIAGRFHTLKALIDKMPPGRIIAVGDLVDRGPRSKEVVEYFMKHENAEVLMGNHEHMMIDGLTGEKIYERGTWEYNGGDATLLSYNYNVPNVIIDWLKALPTTREINLDNKKYLVSHTFQHKYDEVDDINSWNIEENTEPMFKIWNRLPPKEDPNIFLQLAGHNSHWRLKYFNRADGTPYAICLDQSGKKILTGINLPTLEIFTQDYID